MPLASLRRGLARPAAFFDALRFGLLGPSLSESEVEGCNAILAACKGWPISWTAYALATAYHETAHSMQPIKEFGGDAYFRRMYDIEGLRPSKARELGNIHPGDGARFPGMGLVQSTGRANARKATQELRKAGFDVDLEETPELLMRPDIAAFVMRHGMEDGWFTGRRLSIYLPAKGAGGQPQFVQARRIINALDRATDIAGYASQFQTALSLGGWR